MKRPELFQSGYHLARFPLGENLRELVQAEDWQEVDQQFQQLTSKDGALFQFLSEYHDFDSIEFILSIRDSKNDWEEDGIWHDDGSRIFSFSLSLSSDPIEGGRLGVRPIGGEIFHEIQTPAFGGIILFLTGQSGFEHKIHQVTRGRRIIVAGWCSKATQSSIT